MWVVMRRPRTERCVKQIILMCVCVCVSSDINECLEGDFCFSRGECVNTPGSYTCVCSQGFTLTENRTACLGESRRSNGERLSGRFFGFVRTSVFRCLSISFNTTAASWPSQESRTDVGAVVSDILQSGPKIFYTCAVSDGLQSPQTSLHAA